MATLVPPGDRGSVGAPAGHGAIEVAGRPPRQTGAQLRRTRSWMLLFLFSPLCFLVILWFAFGTNGPDEPAVRPVSVPKGYQAITDSYYGYAVPSSYQQNATWTDGNGDFLYGAPATGWVAETMLITKHSPTAATAPPASFESFGEQSPTPYRVSGGHAIRVASTSYAYEVDITRRGGWHAVAVDTWLSDSSTQMWLLIKAPDAVAATVIASLRGS